MADSQPELVRAGAHDAPTILVAGPSNLGPYHLARYRQLASDGVKLHIACCPMPEFDRPWRFSASEANFEIAYPFGEAKKRVSMRDTLRATRRYLARTKPDAVVTIGFNTKFLWSFAWVARQRGIPTFLNLIGWFGERPRAPWKEFGKRQLCKHLFTAALVPGRRSAHYAGILGIRESRIFKVGNVVDNAHFASSPRPGITGGKFIYVGRLSPEKNLPMLLAAYKAYRERGGSWRLAIVGDGPMRTEIEARAGEGVDLLGWASYDHLPAILAESSALILPSVMEAWGLVANEAMAVGLPVLVSQQCGCCPELCHEGLNGFSFDPASRTSLVTAMEKLSHLSSTQLEAMSAASSRIIADYSLTSWSAGLRAAVNRIVLQTKSARTSS